MRWLESDAIAILILAVAAITAIIFVYAIPPRQNEPAPKPETALVVQAAPRTDIVNLCVKLVIKVVVGDISNYECRFRSADGKVFMDVWGPDELGQVKGLTSAAISYGN